jgi:hypothetical protein
MKALIWALALVPAAALLPAAAGGEEHRLRLDEAIAQALQRNEALLVERESAAAAAAAVGGAEGAYDQFLEVEGSWDQLKDPANDTIPG